MALDTASAIVHRIRREPTDELMAAACAKMAVNAGWQTATQSSGKMTLRKDIQATRNPLNPRDFVTVPAGTEVRFYRVPLSRTGKVRWSVWTEVAGVTVGAVKES